MTGIAAISLSLFLYTNTALSAGLAGIEEQNQPSNVSNKKSAFEKDTEKYLSYQNHKAYAIAFFEKDGKDRWFSGYGYDFTTQEQADERALLECQRRLQINNIEAKCRIRARGNQTPQLAWGLASYTGCDDPKYADYIAMRLEIFELREKERYEEALNNLAQTPYETLSKSDKLRYVRDNTIYSARFDTREVALENIERLNSGLLPSLFFWRKNGDVLHDTNIAKSWLALREGDLEQAIHFLYESTNTSGSPVLGSFGPDMSLVREIYKRGHKEAVLEFLKKTDDFWDNEHAMEKKAMWTVMANNDCPIQFQFYDTTNFEKLGLQLD